MDGYHGFGVRRKRNIDLSGYRQEPPKVQEQWEDDIELEEGFEYEEVELEAEEEEEEEEEEDELAVNESGQENPSRPNNSTFYLDGKPFVPKQQPKKQSFAETHVRITTYMEKNIHMIVQMLHKQGQIESITKFVNDSIEENLLNHYHNGN
jgi:hypothetical protein